MTCDGRHALMAESLIRIFAELTPEEAWAFAQFLKLVIGEGSSRTAHSDAVLESKVYVDVPKLSAFHAGGHDSTILALAEQKNSAHTR